MSDFDKFNALNSMPMATQIVGSRDETKLLLTVTEARPGSASDGARRTSWCGQA